MKHYGDITKIKGNEVETVDIITGGSPCQDLSIAGKRAGLSGERSGLFMEQIRIIKEMREKEIQSGKTADDIRPRYMVWENVPGAFSSNKGEDFRAVLEETAKVKDPTITIPGFKKWTNAGVIVGNGFSIAWRTHDAQFWGVPQRRKRISLVADFNGNTAPEILFEPNGVQGDIKESGKPWESSATDVEGRVGTAISFQERGGKPGGGKGILIQNERLTAIRTNQNQYVCREEPLLLESNQNHATVQTNGISTTLPASMGMGGGYVPMVSYSTQACGDRDNPSQSYMEEKAYTIPSNPMSDRGQAVCQPMVIQRRFSNVNVLPGDVSPTLEAAGGGGGGNLPIITTSHGGYMINADDSDIAHTLQATDYKDAQVVSYGISGFGSYTDSVSSIRASGGDNGYGSENLICARDYKGVGNEYVSENKCIVEPYQNVVGSLCARDYKGVAIVRRTTPLECERLQGYEDGYTDIGDWIDSKGKKHKGDADAPRYKALGNSIALPFWEWLAKRMVSQYDRPTEMASLFDGIGGFPVVYSRCGCRPVWASEVDSFCIAVTKRRFPDEEMEKCNNT